jgi:hypothetical protein
MTSSSEEVLIDYTNHRGERRWRRIKPFGPIRFGSTTWHREPQWILPALDLDVEANREFAMKDIHGWKPV